jgi:AraC family transcriptional regulator
MHDGAATLFKRESVPVIQASPRFSRPEVITRRAEHWHGLTAEYVEVKHLVPFAYGFTPSHHHVIFSERAVRRDGETRIDGLAPSARRNFSRTICIVPAGCGIEGWQVPSIHSKVAHFSVAPDWPLLDPALRPAPTEVRPRLFLDRSGIEATAIKLRTMIGRQDPSDRLYAEALGIVFQHELLRLVCNAGRVDPPKGGLAPWQIKRIREYIEENLACRISLAMLAELAGLSTFHFAHAFKQSFGTPPHRYLTLRRIEHAKTLLVGGESSVTDVALAVGFADTSAFTSTFRKVTDATPSDYLRKNRAR